MSHPLYVYTTTQDRGVLHELAHGLHLIVIFARAMDLHARRTGERHEDMIRFRVDDNEMFRIATMARCRQCGMRPVSGWSRFCETCLHAPEAVK